MNGVIYCRVSTKEQVEGTSLETQREACLQYAATRGITVERIFEEQGESAKFKDRTELLKLIAFCRSRKNIQALIVWKVDRFARNVEDHFAVKRELLKFGTAIHSVTEPIDDSPIGKFTETIFAAMAECDNGIRAHRCVEGMRHKLETGIFPWKPPLGYLTINPRKQKKSQSDVRDQERFPIIQEACRLVLSGSYTKADILRFFHERGLTHLSGKPIRSQNVDTIFANKFYAGILTDPWNGKEYKGKHEAMVTPEEFGAIQRILDPRSRHIAHIKKRSDFPLRSFIRCSACMRPMTASWSKGRHKRYAYYHCYSKVCSRYGRGVPGDTMMMEFLQLLGRCALRPRLVPVIKKRLLRGAEQALTEQRSQTERHQKQLAGLEKEKHELIDMRRRKLISDAEFASDRSKLDDDMNVEREAIANSEARSRFDEADADNVIRFAADPGGYWSVIGYDYRQRFQHAIFHEGLVEGQFGTAKKSDAFMLIDELSRPKFDHVHHGVDFWNRVILQMTKLSAIIRESKIFESGQKGLVPNSDTGVAGDISVATEGRSVEASC